MQLTKFTNFLKQYKSNKILDYTDDWLNELKKIKKNSIKNNQENEANFIWCLESMFKIQLEYKKAWEDLKYHKFYDAWCSLEKCEILLNNLNPHIDLSFEQFAFKEIFSKVNKLQQLYPYKIFFSPEMIEKKVRCNICNKIVSIRNHCGHKIGNLYNGEMCIRIVEDIEYLGISMVKNPVQKYSVAFLQDEKTGERKDHYNYNTLKYLLNFIENEFEQWDIQNTTKEVPIQYFNNIKRKDKCPCDSDKRFKDCCYSKKYVQIPHIEFIFDDKNIKSKELYSLVQLDGKIYKNL